MDNTQNVISFCSGYGGLDRGLELAGVKSRTVAYVEIEAFAIANLVAKMETGLLVPAPVWTNLKTFPMEAFRGRVHGITAGYPCQPFSVAGQRKGTDDPRHLWPYIRRIYQTIQPGWMFFENVEGHVTLGLSTVISDLEEDGYKVEAGLFTAAEVGAPHRRKRVFILANARCVGQTIGQVSPAGVVESSELVNAESRSNGQQPTEQQGRNTIGRPSEEGEQLANSNSQRERTGCGKIHKADGKVPERNDDAEFEQSSEVLGNSEHDGLHGTAVAGGIGEAIQHNAQGKNTTGEPSGTDNPRELADTEKFGRAESIYAESCCRTGRWQGLSITGSCNWPSRPGQPQYDWEEPRVVEPGMGRAVDGLRKKLDNSYGSAIIEQTHKESKYEKEQHKEDCEQENFCDEVREVRGNREPSTSSRGLSRSDEGCDFMPDVPQGTSCEERDMGFWGKEAQDMCCLRPCVYARAFFSKDLLSGVFNCTWKNKCEQEMASMRVDRLRLLGNGVVPQQAARAWMILSSLIDKERTGR